jgi:homopolymeric O-antigen transport system permease protein
MLHAAEFTNERTRTGAAVGDVVHGLRAWPFWTMLGWNDVKQRYRRSKLGPLWITMSMAIMIGALSAIYGAIFKLPLSNYLPYLAAGLITWLFVSMTLNEGVNAFINADGIIKQSAIPLSIYVYRVLCRNVIVLLHNCIVLAVIYALLLPVSALNPLMLLVGLVLVLGNLFAISMLLATLATRFRDLPPIVTNLTQVLFYVTPILYEPGQLPGKMQLIAHYNPLYHLINVLRRPLIGQTAEAFSYAVNIGMFIVISSAAFLLYRRFRGRIAYWL